MGGPGVGRAAGGAAVRAWRGAVGHHWRSRRTAGVGRVRRTAGVHGRLGVCRFGRRSGRTDRGRVGRRIGEAREHHAEFSGDGRNAHADDDAVLQDVPGGGRAKPASWRDTRPPTGSASSTRTARLVRILRRLRQPRRVGDGAKNAWIQEQTERIDPPQRRSFRERRSAVQFPEYMPAFESLALDARDRLWVQEFVGPDDDAGSRWTVHDAGDAPAGVVDLIGPSTPNDRRRAHGVDGAATRAGPASSTRSRN